MSSSVVLALVTTMDPRLQSKESRIKVTQINLQHGKASTALLCRCLSRLQTGLALIQEPYIVAGKVRGLNTKTGKVFVAPAGAPRACVYVSKDIKSVLLPGFCTRDLVVVQIDTKVGGVGKTFIVGSIYLPFDSPDPPPSQELERLVTYCQIQGLPLVLGCDSNAHHEVWGSSNTNVRGASLLNFLVSTNLELANLGQEPTFVIPRRQEVIDITLVSQNFKSSIENWHVSMEDSLSDHRYICFDIMMDTPESIMKRNPKLTDWALYVRALSGRLQDTLLTAKTAREANQLEGFLTAAMVESFQEACPPRRSNRGKKVPWWNTELSDLRKNTRALLRQARNTQSAQDWDLYRRAQREYKQGIRRAKQDSWQDFCGGIASVPAAARLYRVLGSDPSCHVGLVKLPDGSFSTSREQSLQQLLKTHFPQCEIPDQEGDPGTMDSVATWGSIRLAREIITEERVRWAIKSFSPFKSAGTDGIFPAMLQHGEDLLVKYLCVLYQTTLALGYIPKSWRRARVVFIPKPGKPSYAEAKAFRPICLTSFLLKTLERLVDRHLRDGPLKRFPLSDRQHAYQTGRSTESALHSFVQGIERALDAKEFALGVFLDIEGAFSNVPYKAIIQALQHRGVSPAVINWITAMLEGQIAEASMDDCTVRVRVTRGCPQGGVLSPLMWSLAVDTLLKQLKQAGYLVVGYADDISVLVRGLVLRTVCELMQVALKIVEDWCILNELSVQPAKTSMVLFTRRRNQNGFTAPTIFGQALQRSEQVKLLGLILDSQLNWKAHTEHSYTKAIRAFWQCRRCVGSTWGLSPRVMHWIYIAIIRPAMAYAVVVWWPRLALAVAQSQVGRLQRLACLCITGALRTTPTAAMEVLLGLTPIHIWLEKEAMAACHRLLVAGTWKCKGTELGHLRILNVMRAKVPLTRMRGDARPSKFVFNHKFQVVYPGRDEWASLEAPIRPGDINVFTDGSRMDGKSGAGVFLGSWGPDQALPLGSHATVPQAELLAIKVGAESLATCKKQVINICSDSQTALQALQSNKHNSRLVGECFEALQGISARNKVTLVWVPGHSDVAGNERADELARQGSAEAFMGPEPVLGIAASAIKGAFKNWCWEQHKRSWSSCVNCRQSKQFLQEPSVKKGKILLRLDRIHLRVVTGILTGHNLLQSHLQKMGLERDATCQLCGEDRETSYHIIGQCPALMAFRVRTVGLASLVSQELQQLPISTILGLAKASGRFDMGGR
ncbi:MAG: hypothetical protein GY886_04310 [Gammaproteobacteria bacterium]|nr:hypothetical protein [Gammaproteobacteria bacterium]